LNIEQIKQLAQQQRDEAKRQLAFHLVDSTVAERIVDCIVSAAMLEVTLMMSEATKQGEKNG
jgi:hypothetical protein